MRRLALLLCLLAACTEPCVEEVIQVNDTNIQPKITGYIEAGWRCDLVTAHLDPFFGIVVLRTWLCSRCM